MFIPYFLRLLSLGARELYASCYFGPRSQLPNPASHYIGTIVGNTALVWLVVNFVAGLPVIFIVGLVNLVYCDHVTIKPGSLLGGY
jgi:hypothetical protein